MSATQLLLLSILSFTVVGVIGRARVRRRSRLGVDPLTDVLVFDGERFCGVFSITLSGDRIATIEPSDVKEPAHTLLPGFIDTHVHAGFFDPLRVARGGVTTVRDLGWPLGQVPIAADGPATLIAGQILTAPGGYPARATWAPSGTAREVTSGDDARVAVAEQVAVGAQVIKIAQDPRGPTLSPDVVRAICDEAAARGVWVTSHCGSLDQLRIAIDAGVRELAHGLWSDEAIPDAVITAMVEAGITVIPTLHIDPSTARIENLRRFRAAGGSVVYGTDMGNAPVPPGADADELGAMMRAGMTLDEVLASATSQAARHLGLVDRGRIEPGARADLLVVDGDLRTDPRALSRPVAVYVAGRRIR